MDKKKQLELLQELSKTNYGKALKQLLDEEKAKIDTVRGWGTKGVDREAESLGRELAVNLIDKIFAFMEKKGQKAKERNQYI